MGDLYQSLTKANYAAAKSIMAMTDDDVTNLELALTSAQLNPSCQLVVRTDDAEFGRDVTSLAPHTHAMSIYALAAEAFAAAALGEKVLNLLRIGRETVLATEFIVGTGDTLEGRLLSEVTSGYGMAAILYQRGPSEKAEFFPPEDIRLHPGNRLIVLATIGGLQNAEHGITGERTEQVRIVSALMKEAAFEGARAVSRVTGCNLGTASALFGELPALFPYPLFPHQAQRLVRELKIVGVNAEVLPVSTPRPTAQTAFD
jgi:Trk K+ transport system NAD-binding subunit